MCWGLSYQLGCHPHLHPYLPRRTLQAETLRILRDKLAQTLSASHGDGGGAVDYAGEGAGRGKKVLLLLALTGCLESVVALAPLRVTAVSGVLLAVPPLLAFGGGRCGVGREVW